MSLKRNKRTYSKELISEIKYLYMYSSYNCMEISSMYDIPHKTIYRWCFYLKRVFETPDFNTGILTEEVIGVERINEYARWSLEDVSIALNKYYGVNDINYIGLKSRI